MEELPIVEANGDVREDAGLVLMALMAHPSDAVKAGRFYNRCIVEGLAEIKEDWWSELLQRQDFDLMSDLTDLILKHRDGDFASVLGECIRRSKSTGAGALASGAVLLKIMQLAEHWPRHASVTTAVDLLERQEEWSSRSTIYKAWGIWKPVSHLWGACILWLPKMNDEGDPLPFVDEHLAEFLGVALTLQRFGRKHRPSGSGTKDRPVLDDEVLTIPATLGIEPVEFDLGSLCAYEQEVLKGLR